MKNIIIVFLIALAMYSCKTSNKAIVDKLPEIKETALTNNDTVRIANEELEYEIIIIEPGFYPWLRSIARQRGYYSQKFLESRNRILVTEYNIRVNQPLQFDPNLYQNRIDYSSFTDYGYEVNYLLYNYFLFFQLEFNQKLGPYIPRV
ncbi:hypothetical protein D7030_02225 [Flavobacteriaceae bacterium AU392]|nr:hypothetical protein D1817_08700 [Flavobacteriaceae bacterium]RKM85513.1 hypothetical protein D7030_02225 [Flavobacteriaceae bacterium AU392]